MFFLSLISLSLCFVFGYLALSNLLIAYRLRQRRLDDQERFRRYGIIRLSDTILPNIPISYL